MRLISRLKNIFQRNARISSSDLMREVFGIYESKTGIPVNWRTAQQAVTFMAGARVIAEGLAQVPCKIFQKKDDLRVPAEDLGLFRLLNDSPNEWQTAYEFFELMGLHLVFCGNFYAFKNTYRGEVTELLPYEPHNVTVQRDGLKNRYWVTVDSGLKGVSSQEEVPAANIWHVRGPSWNSWLGLEGVRLAREAIGLSMATEEHGSRIFKNGAQLSGLLSTDQALNPEKAKQLRDAWIEQYAGLQNSGGVAVTWGGLKYQTMAMLNDQAQFNETRRLQIEEICRALRIMPIMVGHTSDKAATYASAEQMFLAHAIYTMGPWYRRIEKSIDTNLLRPTDRKNGFYTKFIINALMRSAARDRSEYFAKALGAGGSPPWMTQDEVRELEEMNPMGGDAAKLAIPTNPGAAGGNDNAQN